MLPETGPPELTRRMAAGAGWAQASRLAEVFSSLVLSLLLVRALGPTEYGQYSFVVSAATMGAVILSLGFAETLMRFVSDLMGQGTVDKARFLVRRLLLVRLLVYAGGSLLLFALHGAAGRLLHLPLLDRYWIAVALLLVGQGAIEFATSYAYARLRSRDVALARFLGQLLAIAFFSVVVVIKIEDPVTAAIAVAISYLSATALLTIRGLGGALLGHPVTPIPLRSITGFALAAWGIMLCAIGLAGQIDVILLGALRKDVDQIAFYSVATLVFLKLGVLASGWAGTAIPSFAELRAARGPEVATRLFGVYVRVHVLISLALYPPIIVLAAPITLRVFGIAYAPAAGLMAIYGTFWLVSAVVAAGIPLSVLLALGSQRQALIIRGATGVLNVVLDVVLIPPLGALGAIIATGIANGLAHVADFVVAARQLHTGYPWPFALRLLLATGLASIPPVLLHPPGLSGAALATLLYWLIFGAVLLVTKPLDRSDVELVGRLSPRAARVAQMFSAAAGGNQVRG